MALQLNPEKRQDVDAVFAELDRTSGPGCAVGVAEAGRLVYGRGYGIGQMDHRIPLSTESVFYLASVSKQFAAAAVTIAEHEGHLSLDDDIREHIPEFPDYAQGAVTIRHLVHHTSGVRDYLTLMNLAGIPYENILTDEAMLGLIARQKALNFTPGTEHTVQQLGVRAALRDREAVHRAVAAGVRRREDLPPPGDEEHPFPRRPDAYRAGPGVQLRSQGPDGSWRTNYLINFDKVGDGGLYSSVADLAKWDGAFYDDVLGVPGFAERMYGRGVLAGGDTIAYARGLSVGAYRGLRRVSHGGGFMAFRTMIARYPDQRTTVITLCNTGTANPGQFSTAVEEVVLAGAFPEDAPPPPEGPGEAAEAAEAGVDVPESVVSGLAGEYYSPELDATWVLVADGAELVLHHPSGNARALTALSDSVFAAQGAELAFELDGGRATGFVLGAGRVRNLSFERVGPRE